LLFVCFATKAVHIELVTSLPTEAYLAALRRFIARRGKPRTIYSDNGTNFQGAANQLHEIYNMLQSSAEMTKVQDLLNNDVIGDSSHLMDHIMEASGRLQ
jgi:transposase InsO family protein